VNVVGAKLINGDQKNLRELLCPWFGRAKTRAELTTAANIQTGFIRESGSHSRADCGMGGLPLRVGRT